jgi:hypothetical protein
VRCEDRMSCERLIMMHMLGGELARPVNPSGRLQPSGARGTALVAVADVGDGFSGFGGFGGFSAVSVVCVRG